MRTLHIRILSAIVAVLIITPIILFYGSSGIKWLCAIVPILGGRELFRLFFSNGQHFSNPDGLPFFRVFFIALSLFIFLGIVYMQTNSLLYFSVSFICICCWTLFLHQKFIDLNHLLVFQAKIILGFFYVAILPGIATHLLNLPQGEVWFVTMLCVIFSGDTCAYLSGMMWGNKKMFPQISPKKTWVGSVGGLVGSGTAGAISGYYFLNGYPLYGIIIFSMLAGAFGQLGDIFESMLKRIANLKDSGSIMPGHGGILDRVDAVLFGSPIILLGALILEKISK
jgi:phosphatidate cytidylyltransferase